jgi:hypothetical protein
MEGWARPHQHPPCALVSPPGFCDIGTDRAHLSDSPHRVPTDDADLELHPIKRDI